MSNREVKLEVEDAAEAEQYIQDYLDVGAVVGRGNLVRFALTSKHAGAFDLEAFVTELSDKTDQEVEVLIDGLV